MQVFRLTVLAASLAGLTNCSYVPKEVHEKTVERLALLEEQSGKQLDLIEELFNRQEALVKSLAGTADQRKKPEKPVMVGGPDEVSVYSQIIAAFRGKNSELLQRGTRMLKKNMPRSIHLDNAYFLNARLRFEKEQWAEAKEWIYRLESEFPFSSKLPAAKLLNARIEKRLGDQKGAIGILEEVMSEFPGSAEAFQAGLEQAQLEEDG